MIRANFWGNCRAPLAAPEVGCFGAQGKERDRPGVLVATTGFASDSWAECAYVLSFPPQERLKEIKEAGGRRPTLSRWWGLEGQQLNAIKAPPLHPPQCPAPFLSGRCSRGGKGKGGSGLDRFQPPQDRGLSQ